MRKIKFLCCILLLTSFLFAQSTLRGYGVSETEEAIKIELQFTGELPYIKDFVLKNPPRIVVDMENTLYKLPGRIFSVEKRKVLRIRGSQYKTDPAPVARVVIDLEELTEYNIEKAGNKIIISVKGTGKVEKKNSTKIEKKSSSRFVKKPTLQLGKSYFYRSRGKRDPFMPIIEEEEDTLLNVAEARLIGIIRDPSGYVALVEDKDGRGFILKEGDRVRNGRVIKVKPKSVVFAVFDFGFTRRIELKLEEEEKK